MTSLKADLQNWALLRLQNLHQFIDLTDNKPVEILVPFVTSQRAKIQGRRNYVGVFFFISEEVTAR